MLALLPKGFCFAYGMAGEEETTKDLAQEILAQVVRHLATFLARARFSTCFYTISKNHCLNYLRRTKVALESLYPLASDRLTPSQLTTPFPKMHT